MTEFWVSQKKHWCKYCKMFVTDNKISRQNHDSGKRHKDLEQQYIREIQKRQADKRREENETRKILAQVEKDAIQQYGNDLASKTSGSTIIAKDSLQHLYTLSSPPKSKTFFGSYTPSSKPALAQSQAVSSKVETTAVDNDGLAISEWSVVEEEEPPVALTNNKSDEAVADSSTPFQNNDDDEDDTSRYETRRRLAEFKIEEKVLPLDNVAVTEEAKDEIVSFKKRRKDEEGVKTTKKRNTRQKLVDFD
ncbi:hypothetical protein HK098_007810 [Nowakowskiella sp. JEL0407]|nr:hypothetical protein HK098_007810 [Nowakowskiella sp. JEL0407]